MACGLNLEASTSPSSPVAAVKHLKPFILACFKSMWAKFGSSSIIAPLYLVGLRFALVWNGSIIQKSSFIFIYRNILSCCIGKELDSSISG
jgi:hypothetical protein